MGFTLYLKLYIIAALAMGSTSKSPYNIRAIVNNAIKNLKAATDLTKEEVKQLRVSE